MTLFTALVNGRMWQPGQSGNPKKQIELRNRYAEGLAAYGDRRWDDAAPPSARRSRRSPPTEAAMLKRIDLFVAESPTKSWDGAWRLEQK